MQLRRSINWKWLTMGCGVAFVITICSWILCINICCCCVWKINNFISFHFTSFELQILCTLAGRTVNANQFHCHTASHSVHTIIIFASISKITFDCTHWFLLIEFGIICNAKHIAIYGISLFLSRVNSSRIRLQYLRMGDVWERVEIFIGFCVHVW